MRDPVKLNHLDLQVADVPALARFLVHHFDVRPITRLDSPALVVLTDDCGFTLVIQRKKYDTDTYPDRFHIGFLLDTPAEVGAQHARLTAAAIAVSPVTTDARGTRCYCHAPGVLVEIGCNIGSRVAVGS
jgi:hypothetical protein